MNNPVIFNEAWTDGTELFVKSTGEPYIGWYHILNTGAIMTGPNYVSGSMESVELEPKYSIPENSVGELISNYKDDTEEFEGVYTVLPIKNYKNDIDIVVEIEDLNVEPPAITLQPDLLFKKNTTLDYVPGEDILIDDSRTIQVYRGKQVTLQFNFNSFDTFENIRFEWFDSFDRLVSTESFLVVDTNTIGSENETFYCTVTDSYGTDTTNDVTISVIDDTSPYIFKNLIKNGSGNDSTADWETIGDNPEDVGKFLPSWQESVDPFVNTAGGKGTYFYHKFTSGWDGVQNKNQWYPRPEIFDSQNNFDGSVVSEIKSNYFRAGVFTPIVRNGENVYSGITKTSVHTVDLTEFADSIDGKTYGLEGFHVSLFGWIGTRADQADYGDCVFEFLDENDNVIPVLGNTLISSLRHWERTVNDYPRDPWFPSLNVKLLAGYYDRNINFDRNTNFDYAGIIFDGNAGAVYDRYEKSFTNPDGTLRTIGPEVKTCIIGRTSDMIRVPAGTKKIRLTKTYNHEAGVYDLIWQGAEWAERGIDYVSDLMFVGLNLRFYPIVIDDLGNRIETGLDANGNSILTGMDFLETDPAFNEGSVLANSALSNSSFTSYLDGQELRIDSITYDGEATLGESTFNMDIDYGESESNTKSYLGIYTSDKMKNVLGREWVAYCNEPLQTFINDVMPYPNQRLLYAYRNNEDGYLGINNLSLGRPGELLKYNWVNNTQDEFIRLLSETENKVITINRSQS
jgi:hypothetical protein